MIRHITEHRTYSEDEVRLYVVEAIKQSEITYRVLNDELEESPVLSEAVLRGCREQARSSQKKARLRKITD